MKYYHHITLMENTPRRMNDAIVIMFHHKIITPGMRLKRRLQEIIRTQEELIGTRALEKSRKNFL